MVQSIVPGRRGFCRTAARAKKDRLAAGSVLSPSARFCGQCLVPSLNHLHGPARKSLAAERVRQRVFTQHAPAEHATFSACFAPQRKMPRISRTIAFGERFIDAFTTHRA